jgi:rod shape-determining protein MreD
MHAKLKRYIIVAIIIIMAFILQTTIFKSDFLSFGLTSPNLLLMVTFIFGFMRGKKEGIIIGLFVVF